jgi:hypothetical protein
MADKGTTPAADFDKGLIGHSDCSETFIEPLLVWSLVLCLLSLSARQSQSLCNVSTANSGPRCDNMRADVFGPNTTWFRPAKSS